MFLIASILEQKKNSWKTDTTISLLKRSSRDILVAIISVQ